MSPFGSFRHISQALQPVEVFVAAEITLSRLGFQKKCKATVACVHVRTERERERDSGARFVSNVCAKVLRSFSLTNRVQFLLPEIFLCVHLGTKNVLPLSK